MLARVLIQAWTKPRRRDLTAATEVTREYARIFEPATSESARRRVLRCRLSVAYTSNSGGPLSAVLRRLTSMSFRRRSVWIAWLLPEPKVLELPGHSAFN